MDTTVVNQQTRLLRPLGALERWFYLMNQHRQNHFAIAANLSGNVDPGKFAGALDHVLLRQPLLRASIHQDPKGLPAFYEACDARASFQVIRRSSANEWMERLGTELTRRIDPEHPPLFRAVLLTGEEGSELILSLSHAIGDGKSLLYILRDILLGMSGQVLVSTELSPSRERLLSQRMRPSFSKVRNNKDVKPAELLAIDDPRPGQAVNLSLDALLLPASTTQRLIQRCRVEQTSVHAGLLTGLAEAALHLAAFGSESAIRVFSPIDIRAALGLTDQCTLALSASIQSFSRTTGSFWEKARSVKRQLEIDRSLESTVRLAEVFEEMLFNDPSPGAVAELSERMFGYEMMLSNLGEVPFPVKFGDLIIEAVWGPAVQLGFAGEQTVGVATAQGKLSLLLTSFSPIVGLLQRCEELLKRAIS